jgi:Asp-tRNA(Asn)/Glu-tRNA(Gln) amidotransferase A subunit family amidase
MADIALGTQTGGSVIRPASFCGVWGFKPTFGVVPRDGVRVIAPSLDTVGWFGRSAADLEAVRRVLSGPTPSAPGDAPPRFALVRTQHWCEADPSAQQAVTKAVDRARSAGAYVAERDPALLIGMAQGQALVQRYEAARSLEYERRHHAMSLSASLKDYLSQGDAVSQEQYEAVLDSAARIRATEDEVFGDADVLLTLAAAGEAPEGLTSTGDPIHAQLWTLLGWPTIAVPGLRGTTGLPVAVQLVGRAGSDAEVIAAGAWLAEAMRQ